MKKLEFDIYFDRNFHTATIPNKIAKLKDFLGLHAPRYYNSLKFVGGYEIEQQYQTVSNFVIFLDSKDLENNIIDQVKNIFNNQDVYISENNSIPKTLKTC
jgi:hypothetical protein